MRIAIRGIIAKARTAAVSKEPVTVVELLLVLDEIDKVLPPEPVAEFKAGDIIFHKLFGRGEVIFCRPDPIGTVISINFQGPVGCKDMQLDFCRDRIARVKL